MSMVPFTRCNSGASAAEFALVLPLLLLLLLGIIDTGRLAWEMNQAEKATQVGARVAVVTDAIAPGLTTESYVGKTVGSVTLTQGDLIPAAALGTITCSSVSNAVACTCTTSPCPATLGTADATSFGRIVTRMQGMYGRIVADNVEIQYSGSGLGFAGDPNGMEIAPIVTVRLVGTQNAPLRFTPISTLRMLNFALPDFRTSLTAEDVSGSQSN